MPDVPTKGIFRQYAEAILLAVILALFIRTFIVQAFKIPSGSMEPTLLIGDHILVNKFIYGIKLPFIDKTLIPVTKPKRGDVVVFKFPEDPGKDFIKRVIGIPGDVVEIRDKKVYINHKPMLNTHCIHSDPHIVAGKGGRRDNFGPVKVPAHSLFVMGDNRDHSYDSRFWGFVDFSAVKGKAFIIYWSWDRYNSGVRWKRLGHLIR
ncbi:MAG: signal peptidase I [Deltaproteobacteria bacterium]|nr:signal peptidase I [Deltaproteobacteria bacterium]RLB90566.1 MAG: signal peptidase I [Deltaproteobacteria bacterium]RLB96497.1 MAG: signal peptidase I [Deltaproteobacteria bacterium]RLC09210.1 MAG: signal peptidase I [Deltaproteobacteria bacterium]